MASTVVAFLALFLVALTCATSPQKPVPTLGGFSAIRPADADVQKVVDEVAANIRKQRGLDSDTPLTARKYISQSVAGTVYIVEIKAGNDRGMGVIHAKITQGLKGKPKLNGLKSSTIGQSLQNF